MQRDESLRHSHFGEMTDASQVVRVAQRHDATAVLFGAVNAQFHGLLADHLTIAALAIQIEQRARVQFDVDVAVGFESALKDCFHISRQHADAMRVVATQIGFY